MVGYKCIKWYYLPSLKTYYHVVPCWNHHKWGQGSHHSGWINLSYLSLHSVHSKTFLLHTQTLLTTKKNCIITVDNMIPIIIKTNFGTSQVRILFPYSSMNKIRGFRSRTHTLSTEQLTLHWKFFLYLTIPKTLTLHENITPFLSNNVNYI